MRRPVEQGWQVFRSGDRPSAPAGTQTKGVVRAREYPRRHLPISGSPERCLDSGGAFFRRDALVGGAVEQEYRHLHLAPPSKRVIRGKRAGERPVLVDRWRRREKPGLLTP